MRLVLLFLSALSGAVAGWPAAADQAHDHNQAQNALARGEVLPLHAILPGVEHAFGARLLEVEFEQRGGRPIYEMKLISPNGRIFEVVVDAATGLVLPVDEEDSD